MLKELHMALAGASRPRYEIAKELGKPASWMSLVVRGDIIIKPEQKTKLAKFLGKPVDSLFPENELVEG